MLRTNKEAIAVFKRLKRPSRHEITQAFLARVGFSSSVFTKRLANEDFSVNERKIFDEECQPYFEIMPEVLEEKEVLEGV